MLLQKANATTSGIQRKYITEWIGYIPKSKDCQRVAGEYPEDQCKSYELLREKLDTSVMNVSVTERTCGWNAINWRKTNRIVRNLR